MASDGKARPNKQMTITFTLPISCQICLGKVKQPVLCPNHHVFCNLCLEIWLSRNSQCPACRVEIGPDNPVRHVIGGQVEDEDCTNKSTPDFRRARFDLLYQEYEDQLEQMKKETVVLRTENNILVAQLRDEEDKNDNYKHKTDKRPLKSDPSLQTYNGPSLLSLNKKLHEAQKLYVGIKADMTELKQENCKLKDENVHLTRENEILRLEIAQRSPKKFGRYTVATLETKIAEQEKEIKQLQKALERSDSYIEELECQQDKLYDKSAEKKQEVKTKAGQATFQISLEQKHSTEDLSRIGSREGPRKVLFGKEFYVGANNTDRNTVFSVAGCSKSSQKQHSVQVIGKGYMDREEIDKESQNLKQHADSRNKSATSRLAEVNSTIHHPPESPMKSSRRPQESLAKDTDNGGISDKYFKTVHFNVPAEPNSPSSFELDMPSPVSSLVSDACSSANKELLLPMKKSSTHAGASYKYDSQVETEETLSHHFDEQYKNLLNTESLASFKGTYFSGTSKKSKNIGKATKRMKTSFTESTTQPSDGTDDSSHLSTPDVAVPEAGNILNDTSDSMQHVDCLDFSMTPELTDCLKLMNQAEKNVNLPVSRATYCSGGTAAPPPTSVKVPIYQVPHPSFPIPNNTIVQTSPSPLLQYLPTSIKNADHTFLPPGNSISNWEQQFYSTLKVNPYRSSSLNKHHDFNVTFGNNPPRNTYPGNETNQGSSLLDLNPTKKPATKRDFKFSEPIKVNIFTSDIPTGASFQSSSRTDGKVLFKPVNLYQNGPSSTAFLRPTSSSCCNFTTSISAAHKDTSSSPLASISLSPPTEYNLSSTSTGKPATNCSSSELDFPSSITQCNSKYSNDISISMSNSELDWPE